MHTFFDDREEEVSAHVKGGVGGGGGGVGGGGGGGGGCEASAAAAAAAAEGPLPAEETAEAAAPPRPHAAVGAALLGAVPPPSPPASALRRVHRATLYIGIEPPANKRQLLLAPHMAAWAGETRLFLEGIGDPAKVSVEVTPWAELPDAVFCTGGGLLYEGSREDAVKTRAENCEGYGTPSKRRRQRSMRAAQKGVLGKEG